jgi:acetyl-CoA carboxylase carboxyl transferase subunit alpha
MTNNNLNHIQYTAWERVQICRHPLRPHTSDFIKNICDNFTELHGDRLYGDDGAIIGGIGYIGGERCVIIGQEKGKCTESRLKRNFGMPHPEGYRKALRLMKFAEKFELPVVTLIDTAGAFPGLAAEERGQGSAIATNLLEMAKLRVPIICILIGEGCSGGALGIGVGDVIGMLEHSYYSVISPEGCASILWKDAKMNAHAAEVLKIHAEDLIQFGVVDEVIKEPVGGAHLDPDSTFHAVKEFVLGKLKLLSQFSSTELLENRYQKFREMGEYDTIASS